MLKLTAALACLRLSVPSLSLPPYQSDVAEAHFHGLSRSLSRWTSGNGSVPIHKAAGYGGPWIENVWVDTFSKAWDDRAPGTPLSSLFGPFVPLLVPWTDLWVHGENGYPPELLATLRGALRPDMAYITVSQNAQGLAGNCELSMLHDLPNVLVLR